MFLGRTGLGTRAQDEPEGVNQDAKVDPAEGPVQPWCEREDQPRRDYDQDPSPASVDGSLKPELSNSGCLPGKAGGSLTLTSQRVDQPTRQYDAEVDTDDDTGERKNVHAERRFPRTNAAV